MPSKSKWLQYGTRLNDLGPEHNDVADRETPPQTGPLNMEFTGRVIGKMVLDPETKDFKIVPLKSKPQPKPQ